MSVAMGTQEVFIETRRRCVSLVTGVARMMGDCLSEVQDVVLIAGKDDGSAACSFS